MAAKISLVAMAIAMIGVGCGVVRANVYGAFTQIAVTGEAAPGSGGTFSSFDAPVLTYINQIDFQSQDSNGVGGIYDWSNSVTTVIADTTMQSPIGGNYADFYNIASGAGVTFIASTNDGSQLVAGLFNGSIDMIAKSGDSPAAGKTFESFQELSQAGGGTTPMGELITNLGVYEVDLEFGSGPQGYAISSNPDADFDTVPLGASGAFTSFSSVAVVSPIPGDHNIPGFSTTLVAIHGTAGGADGIYYTGYGGFFDTIPLSVLADTVTPSIQHFTSFGDPAANTNNIVFSAHYSTPSGDQEGIFAFGPYLNSPPPTGGPSLQQLVASGSVAPDSGGAHFADFLTVAGGYYMDDIFTATLDNGREGLYVYTWGNIVEVGNKFASAPGTIQCILDTSDSLDGKSIADIEFSSQGAGNYAPIAFKVDFTDGSQGIYEFQPGVPEPASLGIALLGVTLLRRSRRTKSCPIHHPA